MIVRQNLKKEFSALLCACVFFVFLFCFIYIYIYIYIYIPFLEPNKI